MCYGIATEIKLENFFGHNVLWEGEYGRALRYIQTNMEFHRKKRYGGGGVRKRPMNS